MKRRKSGFTLMELMLVIGIVAVMSGLLFPALARARQRSQSVTCINNMRQMWTGLLLYAGDHENRTPYVVEPLNGEDPTDRDAFPNSFYNIMCPTYLQPEVFVCPTAVRGRPGSTREQWKVTYQFFGANALGYDWPWEQAKAGYDDKGKNPDGSYNFGVYTPLDGRPMAYLHTVYLRPIIRDLPAAGNDNQFPHPFRGTRAGTAQQGDTVGNALHAVAGGRIHIEQENKYWSSMTGP